MRGIFEQFPSWNEDNMNLRPVTMDDQEDLKDLYAYPLKQETVRKMIRDYEKCYKEKKEILIGFERDHHLIGILELYHFEGDCCELGYRTCLHGRGHGYTVRAVGILLKALKDTELHKLYACCEKNHHASQKILSDNGFRMIKAENQKYWYRRDLTEI